MLLIVNGVYKSASTRLFSFLVELVGQKVDETMQAEFHERNIDVFNNFQDVIDFSKSTDVIVKVHLFDEEILNTFLRAGAKIVFIDRPLRNILESHWFHYKKESGVEIGFLRYFLKVGIWKGVEVLVYKEVGARVATMRLTYTDVMSAEVETAVAVTSLLGGSYNLEQIQSALLGSDFRMRPPSDVLGYKADRPWFADRPRTLNKSLGMFARIFSAVCYILYAVIPRRVLRKQVIERRHRNYRMTLSAQGNAMLRDWGTSADGADYEGRSGRK